MLDGGWEGRADGTAGGRAGGRADPCGVAGVGEKGLRLWCAGMCIQAVCGREGEWRLLAMSPRGRGKQARWGLPLGQGSAYGGRGWPCPAEAPTPACPPPGASLLHSFAQASPCLWRTHSRPWPTTSECTSRQGALIFFLIIFFLYKNTYNKYIGGAHTYMSCVRVCVTRAGGQLAHAPAVICAHKNMHESLTGPSHGAARAQQTMPHSCASHPTLPLPGCPFVAFSVR